jgi:hypothetical protein
MRNLGQATVLGARDRVQHRSGGKRNIWLSLWQELVHRADMNHRHADFELAPTPIALFRGAAFRTEILCFEIVASAYVSAHRNPHQVIAELRVTHS